MLLTKQIVSTFTTILADRVNRVNAISTNSGVGCLQAQHQALRGKCVRACTLRVMMMMMMRYQIIHTDTQSFGFSHKLYVPPDSRPRARIHKLMLFFLISLPKPYLSFLICARTSPQQLATPQSVNTCHICQQAYRLSISLFLSFFLFSVLSLPLLHSTNFLYWR